MDQGATSGNWGDWNKWTGSQFHCRAVTGTGDKDVRGDRAMSPASVGCEMVKEAMKY
ncbi:hypothetical protein J6590_028846 [Homalodisca vitripennis]|nr:hypothetical protein J6590_028846 [Homalodisca vitripennis]